MKTGVALLRDVKCFVNFFLERICIHLYVANLGRDNNILEQDVALEVSLQNATCIFKETPHINTCLVSCNCIRN